MVDQGLLVENPNGVDLEVLLGQEESNDRDRYSVLLGIGDRATVNIFVEDVYQGKRRVFSRSGSYERVAAGDGIIVNFQKPNDWQDLLLWYDRNSDGLWETFGDPVLFTEEQKDAARMELIQSSQVGIVR